MGRLYTAQFNGATLAGATQYDLFQLTSPSGKLVCVHAINISQGGGGNDVGDAQEEFLTILMKRGVGATTGSGGTTPALVGIEAGAPAAGSVVLANNTTKMTGGTITTLHADSWNVRANFIWIPTPEMRFWIANGDRFTLELGTGPADAVNANATIYFEEVG